MTAIIRWLAPGEIETDISERVDNGAEPRFIVTTYAEEGSVASSNILIRDEDGDFQLVGLNRMDIREDDSIGDDPYIWIGRSFIRKEMRGRYLTGRSRDIDCGLEDNNNQLSRYILGDTEDANRPAEDHGERIAWLMGTDVSFNMPDDSLVLITSSVAMPAYDYTGMSAQQVVEDCARASGYDFFVWFNGVTEESGLVYAESGGDWLQSSIRLSNVISEVDDSTTFYLGDDAELTHDPSRVASRVFARGDGVDGFRTNDPIDDLFGRTDKAMDFPTVRDQSVLTTRTDRALEQDLSSEEAIVKGSVYLPSTLASQFKAGYRFQLHATHLSGYQDDFAHARLIQTTHTLLTPTLYKVEFEAEPVAPPIVPSECAEDATPTGAYAPLNSETTPAGDIAFYVRAGLPNPSPGAGYAGDWHFQDLGTGGSTDFAGYLAGNQLLIGVVGAGSLTVHTAVQGGATSVAWTYGTDLFGLLIENVLDSGTIAAGDDLEIEVDTAGGTECIHWAKLSFHGSSGVKVGYAGSDWVSLE